MRNDNSDYAALPDDGRRYELHQGELSVIPTPGIRHQGAIVFLVTLLNEHMRSRGLGQVFVAPTDCILSDVTVAQPDVLYIATDRRRSSASAASRGRRPWSSRCSPRPPPISIAIGK